jgi:hypothetical protein
MMVSIVGRGVWVVVVVAVASSLFARPAPESIRSPRPSTYPIAANAEDERTHLSPNFSVTWAHDPDNPAAPDLRDRDNTGAPDSVEALLTAFESARAFLIGQLGYRPPPQTGPYPIYIADLGRTPYVRAVPGPGLSRPSFVLFPSHWLRPADGPRALRVLAAHEYFHAIQQGYQTNAALWLQEASSTWVEDVIDDAWNDNHFLVRDFAPYPRRSLTDVGGGYEYGAFLFIQFLVERYGQGRPAIVKEIWTEMASPEMGGSGSTAMAAITAVLARRDVTFPKAWAEFLLWRWDLTRFEEGEAYALEAGRNWPSPMRTTEVRNESCRLTTDLNRTGLPPLSGDYAVFRPADRPDSGRATVTVEGPVGATAFVLTQREGGAERARFLDLGEAGAGNVSIPFGDDQVRRVVVGLGNASTAPQAVQLGYSLRIAGRPAITATPIAPPAETEFFSQLALRGQVLCEGQPVTSANVVLVERSFSGEERTIPLVTGPDGTWVDGLSPQETSTYRFEVVDPLLSPVASPPWTVGVRADVSLEPSSSTVASGAPLAIEGKVSPPHPGVILQIEYRRPELSWRSGPQVSAGEDGSYATSVILPGPGIWQLRATMLSTGDQDHLPGTTIQSVFVDVG